MRPQHITAENITYHMSCYCSTNASMRPQHITAENSRCFDGDTPTAPPLQ